jgi:hypothetical protein
MTYKLHYTIVLFFILGDLQMAWNQAKKISDYNKL